MAMSSFIAAGKVLAVVDGRELEGLVTCIYVNLIGLNIILTELDWTELDWTGLNWI